MNATRVLIVSTPLGAGHAAFAEAVADYLRTARGSGAYDIVAQDITAHLNLPPWFPRFLAGTYRLFLSVWRSWPHRALYALSDRFPRTVSELIRVLFASRARAWLRAEKPDMVISTFSVVSYVLASCTAADVPVISLVTDAGRVNRLWAQGKPDLFLVTEAAAACSLRDYGVDEHRIELVGLMQAAEQERPERLQGAPAKLALMLAGGGVGFAPHMREVARLLSRLPVRPSILMAPGSKGKLLSQVQKELGDAVTAVPQHSSLSVYMPHVDLVIGKAGWATLTEAMLAKTPTLIIDAIPGQESQNAIVAVAAGTARLTGPKDAVMAVRRYMEHRSALERDFRRAEWPEAARPADIARIVDSALAACRGAD